MDDVEKILEKLERLERSVGQLKNELNDLKSNQSGSDDETNTDTMRTAFDMFNDVFSMVRELKKQMRKTFNRTGQRTFFREYNRDSPFDFDFSFDFSNLGEFVSNTVQNALTSLEHITDDIDITPRSIRIKMQPGKDLRYTPETSSNVELPSVEDIQHAKEILSVLESRISSLETLMAETKVSSDTLIGELDALKDKKLLIQEKFGQQRFLITKLGKKVLKNLNENSSGEQTRL